MLIPVPLRVALGLVAIIVRRALPAATGEESYSREMDFDICEKLSPTDAKKKIHRVSLDGPELPVEARGEGCGCRGMTPTVNDWTCWPFAAVDQLAAVLPVMLI